MPHSPRVALADIRIRSGTLHSIKNALTKIVGQKVNKKSRAVSRPTLNTSTTLLLNHSPHWCIIHNIESIVAKLSLCKINHPIVDSQSNSNRLTVVVSRNHSFAKNRSNHNSSNSQFEPVNKLNHRSNPKCENRSMKQKETGQVSPPGLSLDYSVTTLSR